MRKYKRVKKIILYKCTCCEEFYNYIQLAEYCCLNCDKLCKLKKNGI